MILVKLLIESFNQIQILVYVKMDIMMTVLMLRALHVILDAPPVMVIVIIIVYLVLKKITAL